MVPIIFFLCLYGVNIYFSFASIFGLTYDGIESGSWSYWAYLIFLLVFSIFYYLFSKINKQYINKKELVVFFFISLFIIHFLFYNTILNDHISEYSFQQMLLATIFVIPALISGWYFSKINNNKAFLIKNLELTMLILTFGIIFSAFLPLIEGGIFESIGGETYQKASYISANAFGINLFYLIFGKGLSRYRFTEYKWYKITQCLLLIIQLISLFVGGGRGAFVLVVAYVLTYIAILLLQKKVQSILMYLTVLIVILFVLLVAYQDFLSKFSVFTNGIKRVFDFISVNGINWDGTSGRDVVYQEINNVIKGSPVFGVGFFNYNLTHNLFWEVIAATGVLGFTGFIIFIIMFFKKLVSIIKKDSNEMFLVVILLYPLVYLMVSSSVFRNTDFWFVVSYVYFYELSSNKYPLKSEYNLDFNKRQ